MFLNNLIADHNVTICQVTGGSYDPNKSRFADKFTKFKAFKLISQYVNQILVVASSIFFN